MPTPEPDLTTAHWRKSSHSNGDGGSCVEVGDGYPDIQPVRDSKDPEGPALIFTAHAWAAFITDIKADRYPN
jgi:hypothetical protein